MARRVSLQPKTYVALEIVKGSSAGRDQGLRSKFNGLGTNISSVPQPNTFTVAKLWLDLTVFRENQTQQLSRFGVDWVTVDQSRLT